LAVHGARSERDWFVDFKGKANELLQLPPQLLDSPVEFFVTGTMSLQPVKFHLESRDHLESKVVPTVGAGINHSVQERRKVSRFAAELVPDTSDERLVAEVVPGNHSSFMLACIFSPIVKALQDLRVFAPATQVAVREEINEIRVGRLSLYSALLVTITEDKCVEAHFVLSFSGGCLPRRPLPDSLAILVNLADSVERNPTRLTGFIKKFKCVAFTCWKFDLLKCDPADRVSSSVKIADLKLAMAKFFVVTDAAQ